KALAPSSGSGWDPSDNPEVLSDGNSVRAWESLGPVGAQSRHPRKTISDIKVSINYDVAHIRFADGSAVEVDGHKAYGLRVGDEVAFHELQRGARRWQSPAGAGGGGLSLDQYASRLYRKGEAPAIVHMDFADIEARVLAAQNAKEIAHAM